MLSTKNTKNTTTTTSTISPPGSPFLKRKRFDTEIEQSPQTKKRSLSPSFPAPTYPPPPNSSMPASSSPEASRITTTPATTPPASPASPILNKRKRPGKDDEEYPEPKRRSPSPEPMAVSTSQPPSASLLPPSSPVLPTTLPPATPTSPESPKRSREEFGAFEEKPRVQKRARSLKPEPNTKPKDFSLSSALTSPQLPSKATAPAAAAAEEEEISRTASPEFTPNSSPLGLQIDLGSLDNVKLGEVLEKEGGEGKLETGCAIWSKEGKSETDCTVWSEEVELEAHFAVGIENAVGTEPLPEPVKSSTDDLRAMAASIPKTKRNFAGMEALGMHNPATLCYRISALQVLLHNPKFIAWIEEEHLAGKCSSGKSSSCVTCHLRCLVERYWSQSATREAVNKTMSDMDVLFDKLGWDCGGANGQGDPNDHFLWILSQVEKEVDTLAFRKLEATKSLLLNSTMACTLCGDMALNANIKEGLLSIYLTESPKKKCGLVEYIAKYFRGEKIEGHCCDKCGKSSEKSRKFEIVHAPGVLTVQLCRFDFMGRKISTDIPYPEVLDLTPYLVNPSERKAKYKLNGVITHQGGGTKAGHYRSVVKNPADGKWTLVDDAETYSSELRYALQPKRTQHPFILSYLRIPEEA